VDDKGGKNDASTRDRHPRVHNVQRMRTASRQRSPGRLVAFFSGLAALIFARACLIEIEKPLEPTTPDAGVGGSVSAGGSAGNGAAGNGATGGSTSGTSGNDAGDGASCPDGQKRCGGECVSNNDPRFGCSAEETCSDCRTNAVARCGGDAGKCVLDSCNPGFVDCNNDAQDGCEVQFGPEPSELPTLVGGDAGQDTFHRIPGPHDITVDGDRSDWVDSIALVRMNKPCMNCQVNNSPGGNLGVLVENPSTLPTSRNDLEAYFRFTWNADSLFILALVKDDQPLVTGTAPTIPNYVPSPAELQDGVELLIDGDFVLVNGYRSDTDRHLFIGAASDVYNANQKADEKNSSNIAISRTQTDSCYFVEIQIRSPYVRSNLPPLGAGVQLGFDIAVNDWDTERTVPVRAHQAFWREPGTLYAHDSTNFPKVELFTP